MSKGLAGRKKVILEVMRERHGISISELSKTLGVTAVTARSDLVAMEEEGLLVRVRGGAMPTRHPKIAARLQTHKDLKKAIARTAAKMVEDGDTIIATSGTSTALLAKYLLGKRDVHIVTNNTLLLTYVRLNPQMSVTLVGGEFQAAEEGVVGPMAMAALDQFHVSKAFIGIDGASPQQGFTAHHLECAELVRKTAVQAEEVVVMSDSSKFGKPGFARILPFSEVDVLVTDTLLQQDMEADLRNAGVRVVKAT